MRRLSNQHKSFKSEDRKFRPVMGRLPHAMPYREALLPLDWLLPLIWKLGWQPAMSSRTNGCEWRGDLSYWHFATCNSCSGRVAENASSFYQVTPLRLDWLLLMTYDESGYWQHSEPMYPFSLLGLCLHLRYRSIPRAGGDLPFSFSMINEQWFMWRTDHRIPIIGPWFVNPYLSRVSHPWKGFSSMGFIHFPTSTSRYIA